jgi:repressor LexA
VAQVFGFFDVKTWAVADLVTWERLSNVNNASLTRRNGNTTQMSSMKELTGIQRKVFEFVKVRLLEGQSAPSLREVSAKFGWRSSRGAACHINAVVKKGLLVTERGKARSLRLPSAVVPARHLVFEIPLFGSIPAGLGSEREQETQECVPVTMEEIGFKPNRNTFALRVTGDSMIGRHIMDGDIVILEHGPEPRPGQVVAALIDRKSTLKTFLLRGGKPFLKSENLRYPNLIPSEELMIQGVFRALIRKSRD